MGKMGEIAREGVALAAPIPALDINGLQAISIRQPWAWLVVNGYKDIENRDWKTDYRGRILIHVGRQMDPQWGGQMRHYLEGLARCQLPQKLPGGGILGEVISQWRRYGSCRSDSPDAAKASLSQPENRKDIAKDVAIASNSN